MKKKDEEGTILNSKKRRPIDFSEQGKKSDKISVLIGLGVQFACPKTYTLSRGLKQEGVLQSDGTASLDQLALLSSLRWSIGTWDAMVEVTASA